MKAHRPFVSYGIIVFLLSLNAYTLHAQSKTEEKILYKGNPSSSISSSVTVPASRSYYFSAGTTGPVADSTAKEGTYERFGNTYQQSIGILERFKTALTAEGLGLKDVVFMRVYVAPDKKTGETDFKGWFDAYAKYFGTKENPTKPARSTIGVASLVNTDKFIEIEIVVAY